MRLFPNYFGISCYIGSRFPWERALSRQMTLGFPSGCQAAFLVAAEVQISLSAVQQHMGIVRLLMQSGVTLSFLPWNIHPSDAAFYHNSLPTSIGARLLRSSGCSYTHRNGLSHLKANNKNKIACHTHCHFRELYTDKCILELCCRLDPNPWLLLGHFFAVAFYAMYSVFKTQSLWRLHRSAYRSTCVFLSACSIIFPLVWSEVKTVVRL